MHFWVVRSFQGIVKMTILPYNTQRGYRHKMKMQFFYENPIFYDVGQNFYTFFFHIWVFLFFFKEKKRVKKNKTCVKFFPNVVKNRVFGQKLYFHCMPIYEVLNLGQNTNFFLPSFWAPQKNAFFLIKQKIVFDQNLESHLLCEEKNVWKV